MEKIIFNKHKHKIAIIAPGSACEDAEEKLREGVALLQKQGFNVTYKEPLFSVGELLYFAADKDTRLAHLKEALLNPDVRIIWAFRGGYGCGEIIYDCLDLNITTPKILIGFSDITVLHFLMLQKYNLTSIHGSVLTSLLKIQSTMLPEIISVLKGNNQVVPLGNVIKVKHKQKIEGKIVGGNLTMVCNLIGTKLNPLFEDKIIFLEDVNEKGYHIHRHLMHMKNAGLFDKVKAVIFGNFTNSDEYLDKSITCFCEHHIGHIPSFRADGIGHDSNNFPIVFGADAIITDNRLTINSPYELV